MHHTLHYLDSIWMVDPYDEEHVEPLEGLDDLSGNAIVLATLEDSETLA